MTNQTDPPIIRLRRRLTRLLAERDHLRLQVQAAEKVNTVAHASLKRMIDVAHGIEEVAALTRPTPRPAPIPEQTTRRR